MILLSAAVALAIPLQLDHQGRMFDASGAPYSGSHAVNVGLFTSPTGGSALWSEAFGAVDFDQGYFQVRLGTNTVGNALESDLFDQPTLFVEIAVDGVVAGRQPVSSVPYAMRADVAESVQGGSVDASEIRIGGSVVIDNTGSFQGTVAGQTLASLSCSTDQVPLYNGAAWVCSGGGAVTWGDIAGIPSGFADGTDADTLGSTTCLDSQVMAYDALNGNWLCATQTVLDEAAVDGFVGNNGFVTDWSNLPGIPADFADNTDDVLSEAQVENFIENDSINLDSSSTVGGLSFVTDWSNLPNIPAGFADGVDDVLSEADVEAFIENGDLDLAGSFSATGGVRIGDEATTCTDAIAGTLRWTGTALEACVGTTLGWSIVASAIPLGTDSTRAATSCDAIHTAAPGLGSGAYWIDPNNTGTAFQVYCDMSTDGGGWTLVMKQAENHGVGDPLAVNVWSGWSTPGVTLNPTDTGLVDGNMVNRAYTELSATTLRMTASQTWIDTSTGAFTQTVNTTPYTALSDANANIEPRSLADETVPWTAQAFTDPAVTITDQSNGLCWRSGVWFNRTSFENTQGGVKWGWLFNNECSQPSTDTAQGLGCCGNAGWSRTSPWTLYLWAR